MPLFVGGAWRKCLLAFTIGAGAVVHSSPAAAQRPATGATAPSLPPSLRDSLAATPEPVARRVLLERLVRRYPSDPMLHTELSASLLAHPLVRVEWGGGNEPSTDRARDELEAALKADPAYVPAASALVDYALRTHDDRDLRLARTYAERSAQLNASSADAQVALARVAGEQADAAAAVAAQERASALGGGAEPALRAAGIALMLAPGREAEGARLYLRGLRAASPDLRLKYLDDLRYLLADSTYEGWKAAPTALGDSIELFWRKHAAAAGVSVPERVAEHYRRLRLAVRDYAITEGGQKWVAPPSAILRGGELDREFDDRGLVYLKHGKPTHVVAPHAAGLDPGETWVYDLPDGTRRLFHFAATRNASGFRLVKDPLALVPQLDSLVMRYGHAWALYAISNRPEVLDLLEELGRYDQQYMLFAENLRKLQVMKFGNRDMLSLAARETVDREQQLADRQEREGNLMLARETYVPAFAADLPFVSALYQFRSDSAARLVAALAVPAGHLQPVSLGDGVAYSFRVTLSLADTLAGRDWNADTTIAVRTAAPLPPDAAIRVQVPLDVRPALLASYRIGVRAAGAAGEAGKVVGGDLPLRSYPAGALALSDVVVAAGRPGSWHRGDVALALNPSGTFPVGAVFPVFYEIYGLAAGEKYVTTIEVRPDPDGLMAAARQKLEGRKPPLTLSFQGEAMPAADGVVQEVRDVRPQLPPGLYRLRVTVQDGAGRRSASMDRRIRLVEPPKR